MLRKNWVADALSATLIVVLLPEATSPLVGAIMLFGEAETLLTEGGASMVLLLVLRALVKLWAR